MRWHPNLCCLAMGPVTYDLFRVLIYLIPRVISHAQGNKAKGTLIIPQWPSTPFWPLLFPNGSDPANFVVGKIVLIVVRLCSCLVLWARICSRVHPTPQC